MTVPNGAYRDELRTMLQASPFFAELSDEQLEQLLTEADVVALEPGETLVAEGDPADGAYVILDGELEIYRRAAGGGELPIAIRTSGEIVGEMGLLAENSRNATVRARPATRLLRIGRDAIHALLATHPAVMLTLLRTVMERLQSTEAQLVQHQKMAALGTLAAGLAHELNNPAAAVARSAGQLREAITAWERQAASPGIAALGDDERLALDALRDEMLVRASSATWLDPLTRSDREQAVQEWLATVGVDRPWLLAPRLVEAGWDVALLQQLEEFIADAHLADVVGWLAAGQAVFVLLEALSTGTQAISDLVGSVKAYTRLDQAPIQDVDIHEGLEQTLVILQHKLRGIQVRREYDLSLPPLTAYASELNQVWTNLLDNAADALEGQGEITIRTMHEGEWIVVEIEDTGPGIPEAIRHRLFEPFFTTKPPGHGTGLGLAISYTIVRKHHGDLLITSQPGLTRFSVRLPVNWKGPGDQ